MRIRWRGLELPSRIALDEAVSNESYGRFVIEPFEQGFGTTIGNSLRRVLLSSLEGAAVTSVKIDGVSHEFASLDGVLEDVTDILLNIKGIILKCDDAEKKTITVERTTAGNVCAGDFVLDPAMTILNPDHLIATLTADVTFRTELTVSKGRGYATASENRSAEQEIGVIPMDSAFSPVRRVRFRTEDMRVGQRTNYDRLMLEVWTNGTIRPEEALVEASLILRKHLNPFVMYQEMGTNHVTPQATSRVEVRPVQDSGFTDLLSKPVSVMNLSVRACNCLEAARITTIGELVSRTEADLLRFRSFGKTSLHEVQRRLQDLGLKLGMMADAQGGGGAIPNDRPQGSTGPSPPADPSVPQDTAVPIDMSASNGSSTPSEPAGPMEAYTMGD